MTTMAKEIRFYKGKHEVRVMTRSRGNWIVETLEAFEDIVNGERSKVKKGERRIVPPNQLHKRKTLPPQIKEHTYELNMEKRLKRLVQEEKKEDS